METIFFHVDMDAFFASVESLDHPRYQGQPLIVGGMGSRGVVSSCSYEARAYGVHSAMPMFKAKQLCPHGIYVQGRMHRYSEESQKIVEILKTFSPSVQQISIDEAFMDMTGTFRLFGPAEEAARLLKRTVLEKTRLVISVGIGASRYIAKMASSYGKPDGLYRVAPGDEMAFVDKLGLARLWGLGESSLAMLKKYRIDNPQQLRTFQVSRLQKLFGEAAGEFYYKVSRGIDPGIYTGETKSRSISTETTFAQDINDIELLKQYLLRMSHEVMFRALDEQVMGKTVAIKLRYGDFTTISAQITPDKPIYSAEEIYVIAYTLLEQRWKRSQKIRLIGVGLYQLYDGDAPIQHELFDDEFKRKRELEKTVLSLRSKGQKVEKATSLIKHD